MDKEINLAVDCMGSETHLLEMMEGLNESALRNENFFFSLFGDYKQIQNSLKSIHPLKERSNIIHCEDEITMTDKPSEVIRSKKKSVILVLPNFRWRVGVCIKADF